MNGQRHDDTTTRRHNDTKRDTGIGGLEKHLQKVSMVSLHQTNDLKWRTVKRVPTRTIT